MSMERRIGVIFLVQQFLEMAPTQLDIVCDPLWSCTVSGVRRHNTIQCTVTAHVLTR